MDKPRVEVLRRDDPVVRYKVTYPDGTWSTTTRDCSEEIDAAEQHGVDLAEILGRKLGAEALAPVLIPLETSELEPEVKYVLSEHTHSRTDKALDSLTAGQQDLAKAVLALQQSVASIQGVKWAEIEHPHRSLEEAIIFAQEGTTRLSIQVGKQHEEVVALGGKYEDIRAAFDPLRVEVRNLLHQNQTAQGALSAMLTQIGERLDALEGRALVPENVELKGHSHEPEMNQVRADVEALLVPYEGRLNNLQQRLSEVSAHIGDVATKWEQRLNREIPGLETGIAAIGRRMEEVAAQKADVHAHEYAHAYHTHRKSGDEDDDTGPVEVCVHEFTTVHNDGRGYICGKCGIPRSEVNRG